MLTDAPPRARAKREPFWRSDQLLDLALPADDRFVAPARAIAAGLAADDRAAVERAAVAFAGAIAAFHGVAPPPVRVLAARPRRVYKDGGTTELYGDYEFESGAIRVWMRTAVHKRVTAYGTFLSTLCHEICHHLDRVLLGFADTPHTRGFYERTACLYHHARATPRVPIAWSATGKDRWQVDWTRMRRPANGDGAAPREG